ncbi:MAG: CRTAC1 family protein [Planctomycetales bacterium]
MSDPSIPAARPGRRWAPLAAAVLLPLIGVAAWMFLRDRPNSPPTIEQASKSTDQTPPSYKPRKPIDTAGFNTIIAIVPAWEPQASLSEVAAAWNQVGKRNVERIDQGLSQPQLAPAERLSLMITKAALLNYDGLTDAAYDVLSELRTLVEGDAVLAADALYSVIFFQAATALRRGENENCIMCRGESSCIIPIAPAAVHTVPEGSRRAIRHFTEYLEQFPDDLEVRWLLNLAHMTLGEHPDQVDPRYLLSLDHFLNREFGIGKFRDIGHLVGINRFNQAGGAILDDFNNDGWLDFVTTSMDPTATMALFVNNGQGRFENQTAQAGLEGQLGGLYCVQTDYNNDGYLDIFIPRGAWLKHPIRPSLLRNEKDGTFSDVTLEAGLLDPVNAITSSWTDFDNDGWLDLFICCERQPNRLYRNRGDGVFNEVALEAGLLGRRQSDCKGAAWLDYDNDGYPDLFLNYLAPGSVAELYHNNRDGTFSDVTAEQGIDGPAWGFSCWAFDYDNDGWLDIFATSYDRTLKDVVRGILGESHSSQSNRLYRNLQGRGFEDVTSAAGLDMIFVAMGSNFADFDNDGWLDMYLGTGDPSLATLVPNRMLRNLAGERFVEITGSSGTGNLQKGHGVACGDWDRNGSVDLFIQMGGAIHGDKYHNILFQNPGQGNHWLTLKLVGKKSNRAAIGARIRAVTAGPEPLTIHRHVSSGSSFGANPLQQTLGLGSADRLSLLEVYWPASGTTQVFRDVPADQALEITEFSQQYRRLDWTAAALPE